MENSTMMTYSVYVPIELDVNDALYPRFVNKCIKEGITPDEKINHLMRAWVEADDTAPTPSLGCDRPLYSFTEYIDYRSSTRIPIVAELREFRAFTQGQGEKTMAEWIVVWNAFCAMQDADDERNTQADALR